MNGQTLLIHTWIFVALSQPSNQLIPQEIRGDDNIHQPAPEGVWVLQTQQGGTPPTTSPWPEFHEGGGERVAEREIPLRGDVGHVLLEGLGAGGGRKQRGLWASGRTGEGGMCRANSKCTHIHKPKLPIPPTDLSHSKESRLSAKLVNAGRRLTRRPGWQGPAKGPTSVGSWPDGNPTKAKFYSMASMAKKNTFRILNYQQRFKQKKWQCFHLAGRERTRLNLTGRRVMEPLMCLSRQAVPPSRPG